MLWNVKKIFQKLIIFCDNVPVHVDLEKIIQEDKFISTTSIPIALYGAPLNPIDECWRLVKATMKHWMAETFDAMMASLPTGVIQTEYRLRYEEAIDEVMSATGLLLCIKTYNHIQKHGPTLAQ